MVLKEQDKQIVDNAQSIIYFTQNHLRLKERVDKDMIYIHIAIYFMLIIHLYKFIFGLYKGNSGLAKFITEKTEPLIITHPNQVNESYKKTQILSSIIKMILILMIYIGSSAYHYIFVPEGYKVLDINNQNWGSVVLLILLISMIGLIVYPIHSKKYLARRFLSKNKKGYYVLMNEVAHVAQDLNKVLRFAFYIVLVIYPIYIISLNQYSYYNENEIITRNAFEFRDKVIKYENIDKVERYFKSGPYTDKISTMHYIIYYDEDNYINILFPTQTEQTLEIHNWLKHKRPELFEIYTITDQETIYIESKSSKIKNHIYEIFG